MDKTKKSTGELTNYKHDNIVDQDSDIEQLFQKLVAHINNARKNVQQSIDTEMVKAHWLIGRDIIEEEQGGAKRSKYGTYILDEVSKKLTQQYGRGFSKENLKRMRQFYISYENIPPIGYAVNTQSKTLSNNLGWMHYRALMRVSRPEARSFYEIEAIKNKWAGRELERQINSLLFDRLAKSKDKEGLLQLANKGHQINTPEDAIKEPVVLEFLDLPESNRLVESKLEEALINNLQAFLLEMGAGLAYVGRQKRLTLDSDHYYADLVFYSIPLKAYFIIDLKVDKLTHSDVGQMLLYVNYFDREIKGLDDNPTIGLILCTEKSNEMVKYMLTENNKQIFASKYQLYLPSKEVLETELKRELELLRARENSDNMEL